MDNKEELEEEEEKMDIKEAEADEVKEKTKQEIITIEEAERIIEEDEAKRIKNFNLGVGAISLIAATIVGGVVLSITNSINHPKPKNSFTYKIDREGKIQVSGRVKYSEVNSNWKLLEKELNNGESKLYIVDWYFAKDGGGYINIHTDKSIADSGTKYIENSGEFSVVYDDPTVLNVEDLGPYLLRYDMVYDNYTIEDMDRLLGLIEADYEYSTLEDENKVMMKIDE